MVLPYIDMNPPRVYMRSQTWTPLPRPSPQHPSGLSLCTSPKHAVSCIGHRLVIQFLHDSIHVTMPFSQIIPPSPSPSESKSPLYTSVSFLLSCIQGGHCHLSKLHIYVLVYCIDFKSGSSTRLCLLMPLFCTFICKWVGSDENISRKPLAPKLCWVSLIELSVKITVVN